MRWHLFKLTEMWSYKNYGVNGPDENMCLFFLPVCQDGGIQTECGPPHPLMHKQVRPAQKATNAQRNTRCLPWRCTVSNPPALAGCSLCQGQSDNCSALHSKRKKRRLVRDVMERGGLNVVQWRCEGASQMSMLLSRQLSEAMQSVSACRRKMMTDSIRSPCKTNPKQTKNETLSSSSLWSAGGVTAEAGRSPSLWPCCVFCLSPSLSLLLALSLSLFWRRLFFISAFQSVLLIYKPSRNVREWKNRSALPCACSVVVPPVLFVLLFFDKYIYNYFFSFGYWFFFLCFYRVGENSGTRRDWVRRTEVAAPRKLQTPTERVGLVTAERGIVPLVCDDLNGRDSSGPKPRPRLKTEVIQL